MGLLEDVIGGVLNQKPAATGRAAPSSGGGMSPMMMAMMAYLAYRTLSGHKGAAAGTPQRPSPGGRAAAPEPDAEAGGGGIGDILGQVLGGGAPTGGAGARVPGGQSGGGLGDILGQILGGGSPGGDSAGGRTSGLDELSDIVERFDKNGQGDAARSWVGRGENKQIRPDQMSAVLDGDTLQELQAATGIDRDELLAGLAQTLPGVVDRLTPSGRLPTPQEWQRS